MTSDISELTGMVPERLGKFDIVRELGRGSMAVVYMGYDPFMDRNVAVKVALPKYLRDPETGPQFKKMFFNEARIAGMLDNKFILPVYDAGIEGDLLYIVMEFVPGGKTLKDFCKPETLLPIPKVLEIVYKCCRALDYAHSRDVIHRDIKPTNILVTEDMDVRIADFGIAQVIKAEDTQVMGVMGSPRYMSPEQLSEKTLTNQTDIFSLGVVMYELLTANLPFNANNLPGLANQILNEEQPLLQDHRPDIPDAFEMIVKRALAKNPVARYPRGMDFASDINLAFKHQSHVVTRSDSTKQEKFKRLKANIFFKDFFDSEIWEVIDHSEWAEYAPNEVIVTEGDLDDSFYIIIKGNVEVRKGDARLSTLTEGDCFGEMAYFSKSKRTASIVSADDVMLTKVTSSGMEKASTNCQLRFMKVFLYTLIERLTKTSAKLTGAKAAENSSE
jgi:serine/threonine protein kinase